MAYRILNDLHSSGWFTVVFVLTAYGSSYFLGTIIKTIVGPLIIRDMEMLAHPDETLALIRYALFGSEIIKQRCDFESMSSGLRRCYWYLEKRSKNFAAAIGSLGGEVGNAICILYLVLRALDTIEDDMTIPKDVKLPVLRNMYTYLQDPKWKFTESKDKDKIVLEEFPILSREFRNLSPALQIIVSDTTKEMGMGMAKYIEKTVDTFDDLNEYCYYVAGLTGTGAAGAVVACALEEQLCDDTSLAIGMGRFLQKTNIICDCLDDLEEGRGYWPTQVWQKYSSSIKDLTKKENRKKAVHCVNELITDALQHIPDIMKFFSLLTHNRVKTFMTIPQMVAIARLEKSYNNPEHFVKTLKIRKGQTLRIMNTSRDIESVKSVFYHYLNKIYNRIPADDPNALKTKAACLRAMATCRTSVIYTFGVSSFYLLVIAILIIILAVWLIF
ncbi:hypothetical protein ScPMuIL_004636 [Solemya velum]